MVESLLRIPGLGLLTATALFATIGDIHAFKSGRQLACWLGLTPRESSSGGRRHLGRISKQGDAYLRMLFIHGARAALNGARRLESRDQPLSQLQHGRCAVPGPRTRIRPQSRLRTSSFRIAWAVWYHERDFDGDHVIRVAA